MFNRERIEEDFLCELERAVRLYPLTEREDAHILNSLYDHLLRIKMDVFFKENHETIANLAKIEGTKKFNEARIFWPKPPISVVRKTFEQIYREASDTLEESDLKYRLDELIGKEMVRKSSNTYISAGVSHNIVDAYRSIKSYLSSMGKPENMEQNVYDTLITALEFL